MVAANSEASDSAIRARECFSGYPPFQVVFWSNACDLRVNNGPTAPGTTLS